MSWRRRRTTEEATGGEQGSRAPRAGATDRSPGADASREDATDRPPADDADDADDADPAAAAARAAAEAQAAQAEADETEAVRREALETRRAQVGPFDASEVSGEHGGVDLGALRLDPPPGAELRLEVEAQGRRVVAATLVHGSSSVQVHVFAAPRTAGVWDEVRAEIAASVAEQGGATQEVEVPGGFGRELLVRMPGTTPDGQPGFTLTRFSGVDGPRWFLRAVFSGQAAVERAPAAALEAAVRSAVVVRGDDAMAPRDLLELRLPDGAVPAPGTQAPAGPGPGGGGGTP